MSDSGVNIKISNMKYEQSEIGRLIKGTKIIYSWDFVLDGNRRKVELIHSRITGKRRISLDGKNLTKCQKYTMEFQYSFLIEKHYVIVIQVAPDMYELRIDNVSFSTLMNKEKINNFNRMRNDNYESTAEVVKEKKKKRDEDRPSVVKSEVNKIEDDFFENCENKFSTETNFKDKNYFENNQWNFEENKKKDTKQVEGNTGSNFFNVQDFNFDDKPLGGQNNLLVVNSKNKKVNENSNEPPKQTQTTSLLDFNDIFTSSKNDGFVQNSAPKNNDVFSMIDFNATTTNTNTVNTNTNNAYNTNPTNSSNNFYPQFNNNVTGNTTQPKFDFNGFNDFNNSNPHMNNYKTNIDPGFNLNYVNTNLNQPIKTTINPNNFNFNFNQPQQQQQPAKDILDLGMSMGGTSQFKKQDNKDFEFKF